MEEQREVLGENWLTAPLDFESVGKMEYLQNCVVEVLRMHPPLILLMRMAMSDIETTTADGQKFTIPKGDIVITSPAASGRLESVFKNADKFEPDRFGPERNEHKKVPYSFLGFGGGRHACLGQQFGLLQVKTIVSVLVRNYKFEAVDKEFPQPDFTAMVVGPMNHTKLRYEQLATSTL
jgi:sterol 14-demethylase